MVTKLDQNQIFKAVYVEADEALRASLVGTSQIELSAADGDSIRVYSALEPLGYDYVGYALSSGDAVVTETYRSGGAAGTVVGTITRTYTDSTRTQLVSVART